MVPSARIERASPGLRDRCTANVHMRAGRLPGLEPGPACDTTRTGGVGTGGFDPPTSAEPAMVRAVLLRLSYVPGWSQ